MRKQKVAKVTDKTVRDWLHKLEQTSVPARVLDGEIVQEVFNLDEWDSTPLATVQQKLRERLGPPRTAQVVDRPQYQAFFAFEGRELQRSGTWDEITQVLNKAVTYSRESSTEVLVHIVQLSPEPRGMLKRRPVVDALHLWHWQHRQRIAR